MKRYFALACGSVAVLVGCGSFNNSFNTYTGFAPATKPVESQPPLVADAEDDKPVSTPVVVAPPTSPVQTAPQVIVAEAKPCTVSAFVSIPKPPEIPMRQLQEAGDDIKAIEIIERKHIAELRAYISMVRNQQNSKILDFNAKCKAVGK